MLYPGRLPEFHRLEPAPELSHALRWFWIPEWDLPEGTESRQELLPFPACNLVVEPHGIHLFGPATRVSERTLRGRGWAVGALLRPAAAVALAEEPSQLRDSSTPIDAPDIHRAIVETMDDSQAPAAARRSESVRILGAWLSDRTPEPAEGAEGALANKLEQLLADSGLVRVDQIPALLHISMRSVQRLAARCFGLSAHAMIQRRRLQEGAERLREDPALPVAVLAGELGYTDHAHFTNDFRSLLGVTPSEYRSRAGA